MTTKTPVKGFTKKFCNQAELLRASLEAMPLHRGCEHLFSSSIDIGQFLKYLAVTRHGMPLKLLSVHSPWHARTQLEYNALNEDDYFQFSCYLNGTMTVLAHTLKGARESATENMKFMEAFDANMKHMIAQIRKPVMSKAAMELRKIHEAFVAGTYNG